jgi:hypothetical protein
VLLKPGFLECFDLPGRTFLDFREEKVVHHPNWLKPLEL